MFEEIVNIIRKDKEKRKIVIFSDIINITIESVTRFQITTIYQILDDNNELWEKVELPLTLVCYQETLRYNTNNRF